MRWRALGVGVACVLIASCSASSDPVAQLGFASASSRTAEKAEGDGSASFPAAEPGGTSTRPSPRPQQNAEGEAQEQEEQPVAANVEEPATEQPAARQENEEAAQALAAADEGEPDQAAADDSQEETGNTAPRSFLSAFFSPAKTAPVANPKRETAAAARPKDATAAPSDGSAAAEADEEPEKPVIARPRSAEVAPIQASFSMDALPGVRANDQLFEIKRRSSVEDDSDIDLYEDGGTYQVAAAAGLARLAPNGLLKQRESVDVSCFKPELVRMLKTIERHYRKPVLVTSGYRSPEHNRRVRGAPKSMHMYCAAADIQVEGVSKWELASFVRALPGRGGVGTYCHTKSVHVDVGPEREWNWRCRRKG